ncbi:hypothetical protein L1049_021069 [Liquidambar formosana]|uniref:Uncharacterized protein n=1 Tax=Liquidambar formosana TaxID=63359 RepID=A0AAP0S978_LIQFO
MQRNVVNFVLERQVMKRLKQLQEMRRKSNAVGSNVPLHLDQSKSSILTTQREKFWTSPPLAPSGGPMKRLLGTRVVLATTGLSSQCCSQGSADTVSTQNGFFSFTHELSNRFLEFEATHLIRHKYEGKHNFGDTWDQMMYKWNYRGLISNRS